MGEKKSNGDYSQKKQSTKDVQDISLTSNTEIEERGWGD